MINLLKSSNLVATITPCATLVGTVVAHALMPYDDIPAAIVVFVPPGQHGGYFSYSFVRPLGRIL